VAAAVPAPTPGSSIAPAQRDVVLPPDWRTSPDRVVTTDGDMTGLHVLVAEQRTGYTWRVAATLSEPGTETDQWIGQSCLTGSGRRAVVVYAPRSAVNRDESFRAGALAAVVDLDSGAVTKLPALVSLAYYNPGCGVGERAALTQSRQLGDRFVSRLLTVDASAGKIVGSAELTGQITSAVPFGQGLAAVRGHDVVAVDAEGRATVLTDAVSVPFRLAADRAGGLGYETRTGDSVTVNRLFQGRPQVVATAPVGAVTLSAVAGQVALVGPHASNLATLPATWAAVDAEVGAEPSTTGAAVILGATSGAEAAATGRSAPPGHPTSVSVRLQVSQTARQVTFVVPTAAAKGDGSRPSPALTPADAAVTGDYSGVTTDPDRACAIARNDPKNLSLQETPAQAEWAADLAVKGALTDLRPAGWNGSDLPAYTPQGLFPSRPLAGGGQVPAQVLLGVLAQESNMWQATPHAVDGESGNFEQGGFYGSGSLNSVNWGKSDCGYGAAQVTTGMRVGNTTYTHTQQLAIAVDYAANIAAGLQVLQDKWNQLAGYDMKVNNGDPRFIENWWLALWAYNAGYHKLNDSSDPYSKSDAYGLGWSNNPANEDYPADRAQFLDNPDDAKHPNLWTYPERVMGFASHSLVRYSYADGTYKTTFAKGVWSTTGNRPTEPVHTLFCTVSGNQCDITKPHKPANYPDDKGGPCQRDDLACYWHLPATWTTDTTQLGQEVVPYLPGAAEPTPQAFYRSDCRTSTLPAGALVIDDQPNPAATSQYCPTRPASQGSFSWNFAADSAGHYPSKIDLHQLDTGFDGHLWFAHTWTDVPANAIHRVTGTWTLNRTLNGWARVLAYVPDHGADSPQQWYTVHGADTTSATRAVTGGNYLDNTSKPVGAGTWRSLGVFNFTGTPSVSLDNTTHSGVNLGYVEGSRDVAWDAVAFQPLAAQPPTQLVAVGDSYSSGEGTSHPSHNGIFEYYPETDHDGKVPAEQDACHRSPNAWSRLATLPGNSRTIGARADSWDPTLEYQLRACSAAYAVHLMPTENGTQGYGEFNEGAQLDQGYLDQHTTQVVLSLGGNDARFMETLEFCATPSVVPCQDRTYKDDGETLGDHEPKIIQQSVVPAVSTVITKIHKAAPNAKIMLMGYPRLMYPNNPSSQCDAVYGNSTILWFEQIGATLDSQYSAMVSTLAGQGVPVTYVSSIAAFHNKEACTPNVQYINAFVVDITPGESPQLFGNALLSQQSFHPNPDGSATYAALFTEYLKSH
jgi:hypothetical protein